MLTRSTFIGCVTAIASSAIQALGITLQRKAHTTSTGLSARAARKSHRIWLVGICLFVISNVVGSLIQIQTLPLIVLSPLQSIGLVFNSLFACLLLREEHFTRRIGYGTFAIAVGASIVAYNSGATDFNPWIGDGEGGGGVSHLQRFKENATQAVFLRWFCSTIGLLLVLAFASTRMIRESCKQNIAGAGFGIVSGTLTAHTFLFAKGLIDVGDAMLSYEYSDFRATIRSPILFILVSSILATVVLQLTVFNMGLRCLSSLILYPLCFLVFNSVSLVNDILFNRLLQSGKFRLPILSCVIFGLLLVLFGVVLISWNKRCSRLPKPSSPYSDDFFTAPRECFSYELRQMFLELGRRTPQNKDIATAKGRNHNNLVETAAIMMC